MKEQIPPPKEEIELPDFSEIERSEEKQEYDELKACREHDLVVALDHRRQEGEEERERGKKRGEPLLREERSKKSDEQKSTKDVGHDKMDPVKAMQEVHGYTIPR